MKYVLKGWKTIIVNVAGFLLLSLAVLDPKLLPLDGAYVKWFAVALPMLNVWLRMITNTAVGKKD